MSISVLLFASYADALGGPSISVDLPDRATVADVVAALARKPGAESLPPVPLVAVNQRFASMSTPVNVGDEIALIPPVAGG
jgi:molybdopterin synthase sulfur carrier subunit